MPVYRESSRRRTASIATILILFALHLAGCGTDGAAPEAVGTLAWDRVELVAELAEPITEIAVAEGGEVGGNRSLLTNQPWRALSSAGLREVCQGQRLFFLGMRSSTS